jgi:hypothetical protein
MLPYCIRPGESTYNAQGRVQGHLNIRISRLEIDGAIVRRYTLNEVGHLQGIGLAGAGDL